MIASHMNHHFQCVEPVKSPFELTKYCACHEFLRPSFQVKLPEVLLPTERRLEDIRWYSVDIPRISEQKIVISHPPLWRPDSSSHLGDAFCVKKYNISRSGYLPKLHEALHLPREVALQTPQILRLPRKMTLNMYKVPWHLFSRSESLRIYSLSIYSLPARQLFSTHLFSRHLVSKHLCSTHLFSLLICSRSIYSLLIYSLRIYSHLSTLCASFLSASILCASILSHF